MKRISIIAFLTLLISGVFAGNTLPSKIENVTLFRNGAQLVRKAGLTLKQGENTIVLGELPAGFDVSSIRVSISGKAMINGVSYRDNHIQDFSARPEYLNLQKQLELLQDKAENEQLIYDTWKEEEGLIQANKKLGGETTGVTAAQLAAVADMYRNRLLEVKQKMLDSKRRQEENYKTIAKIQAQINEWTQVNGNRHTGEVVVDLYASTPGEAVIKLIYFDPRATWTTHFEARVTGLTAPMALIQKAKINQYTGEDWQQVSMSLTTGDPSYNTVAPVVNPWFLYFNPIYQKNNYALGAASAQVRSNARPAKEEAMLDEVAVLPEASARENLTFTEYTLAEKTSIPADNNLHEVHLKSYDIPAKYHYKAVPGLDNKVYLMAEITEWDQYNLSSGAVKLFVEDTYLGDTYLNMNEVSDTLALSLGPDIAVAVKREKVKEYQKTSFLSSKKQLQKGWELSIKNNKTTAIEVTLIDQIPLSTSDDIEVEVDDLSGGKLDAQTGIVEWKLSLKPGEQIKKKLTYKVKIPKDQSVNL